MTHGHPRRRWPRSRGAAAAAALAVVALTVATTSRAQSSAERAAGPERPAALSWAAGPMRLDGALDEPAWQRADSIADFTQRDPREGAPASERTVVRLVATDGGLFVGLWAYDRDPAGIRRAQLRRDADLGTDDSFTLMLDAQHDRRSGFLFSVNPNGALRDAEILTFEGDNPNWDGIWDARARVTPEGWVAELFIPWATLRYRRDAAEWGLNMRRYIRRKNEESLWRAWRRPEGIRFLEREGTLAGLRELPRRARAELRPYALGATSLPSRTLLVTGRDSVLALGHSESKVGADAKLAVAPTLTLDLTVNTDFAQAEVDRQVVNLTRFPLFFPETRPFFLEGAGIFDFGRQGQTQLFYSRRVGLGDAGDVIPLLAGARLTGRAGRQQVGLLAVRSGGREDALDVVARAKRDVLGRGYVGAMLTGRDLPGRGPSVATGADFNFPYIVRGQNLVLLGGGAVQRDSGGAPTEGFWRFVVDYPNDNADIVVRFDRVSEGFSPPLGFVQQPGSMRYAGQVELTPRPGRWGVRKLLFAAPAWDVVKNLDGTLSNAFVEVRPLGAEFESGDEVELNFQRIWDVPADTFEVFPGSRVSSGRYRYDRAELAVGTSGARPVIVEASVSVGEFYRGRSAEAEGALRWRRQPHVLASVEYARADVRRPRDPGVDSAVFASFTANTARLRLDVAASPRLNTTLFGQWDNESERVAFNARVRWTRSPGSDAYVVWNSAWPSALEDGGRLPSGIRWRRPTRGVLVVKYVHYLRV